MAANLLAVEGTCSGVVQIQAAQGMSAVCCLQVLLAACERREQERRKGVVLSSEDAKITELEAALDLVRSALHSMAWSDSPPMGQLGLGGS